MGNSIAPGSSADINVKVTALTTNPNVPVTYKTIILKKNLVNGVNTLTQEMMSSTNTKYVIKYDYVLGEDIVVPTNCILEFGGGHLSGNNTLTGQNTDIIASKQEIFDNVIISGSWNVYEIYASWFHNYDNVLRNVIDLSNDNIQNKIIINETYNFNPTSNEEDGYNLKSNTEIVLDGNLTIKSNPYPFYYIIHAVEKNNIVIHGSGSIIGDAPTHDYTTYPGTHEWGYAIFLQHCKNVTIEGINIYNLTADGIVIVDTPQCVVKSCNIHDNRRCGIGITSCFVLVEENYIQNNGVNNGTAPYCAIDIECEYQVFDIHDVYVRNNLINGNFGVMVVKNTGAVSNVFIENNNINVQNLAIWVDCKTNDSQFTENVHITGNVISSVNPSSAIANITVDTLVINGVKDLFIDSNKIEGGFILIRHSNVNIKNNTITIKNGHLSRIIYCDGHLNSNKFYAETELAIMVDKDSWGFVSNLSNPYFEISDNIFDCDTVFYTITIPTRIHNNTFIYSQPGRSVVNGYITGDYEFVDNIVEILDMTGVGYIFNVKTATSFASYKRNTFKLHNRQGDAEIAVNDKIYIEDNRVILINDVAETKSFVEQKLDTTVGAVGSSIIRSNGLRKYSDGTQWVDATNTPV